MRFLIFTVALLLACPTLTAQAQVAPPQKAEKEENPLVLARVKDSVAGFALSPDGKRLVASHLQSYERSDDGQVSVWDIPSKRLLVTLRDQSGAQHPAFSPDGKTLVTTNGQWLKAWDLPADLGATPAKP